MVGFICFALTGSCHLISLEFGVSFDGLILRFLNLLICSFLLSLRFGSVFQGSALSSSVDASLLSSILWSFLHSLRSPKVRLLLSAIIQGKADEPFCGFKVHRTQPLSLSENWPWRFRVSPFSVFLSGFSRFTERSASLRSIFFFIFLPSLVRFYNTTALPFLSSVF